MSDKQEAANVAATVAASVQRIEIVGERRRAHDAVFRSAVVAESVVPGTRVQELARRHGICASLIYRWRRVASPQAGGGTPVQLLPVQVTEDAAPRLPIMPVRPSEPRRGGIIEIEFGGGVRVRIDDEVSLAALRRVVTALRG